MKYEVAREKVAKRIAYLVLGDYNTQFIDVEQVWIRVTHYNYDKEYYDKADQVLALLLTPAQIAEWQAGGKVAVIARDQSLPDKNTNNTWYDDDYGQAGKIGWDLCAYDMLKANFRRVVE